MSQGNSQWTPNILNERSIRIKADYQKGMKTSEAAFVRAGNRMRLQAFLNETGGKINVPLAPVQFTSVMDALRRVARSEGNEHAIKIVVQEGGGKKEGGGFNPPKDIAALAVSRCSKSNRVCISVWDLVSGAKERFFFQRPSMTKYQDLEGNDLDAGNLSSILAISYADMWQALGYNRLAAEYQDFRNMQGGNRGGGGGYGNRGGSGGNNNSGGGNQSGGGSNGGSSNSASFDDDEFSF